MVNNQFGIKKDSKIQYFKLMNFYDIAKHEIRIMFYKVRLIGKSKSSMVLTNIRTM